MSTDLRLALRQLLRSPGYAVAVIVLLGLGLGSTMAVWTTIDTVLLRPLPYKEPERLVQLWESNPEKGWVHQTMSPANFLDVRERLTSTDDVAAWSMFGDTPLTINQGDEAFRLSYATVTGNLFSVLGVRPAEGRFFTWEETWDDSERVVVLSHRAFQTRFGADPSIVGKTLDFPSGQAMVIGVAPRGMRLHGAGEGRSAAMGDPDLWIPYRWSRDNVTAPWFRRAHFVTPVARVADGADVETLRAEIDSVFSQLRLDYPELNRDMSAGLTPLKPWVTKSSRGPLWVLFAAVLAMLLIACSNVISLTLVRINERRREWALRRALGAGRTALMRLQLIEGAVLSLLTGVVVALVGGSVVLALRSGAPTDLPRLDELGFSVQAVFLALAASALITLACTSVPMMVSNRERGRDAKKRALSTGQALQNRSPELGSQRGAAALIVGEVAMAVLLVAIVGLLARSLLGLYSVDTGFDPAGVLTATIEFPSSRYDATSRVTVLEDLLDQALGLPGVTAAGAISALPLKSSTWTFTVSLEGLGEAGFVPEIRHMTVDPGYFEAARVAILAGRGFTESDGAETEESQPGGVVVVNRLLVERYLDGRDPIGMRLKSGRPDSEEHWTTIVGVVEDEAQNHLAAPLLPQLYVPYRADPSREMTAVLRTDVDPMSVAPSLRTLVDEVAPGLPLNDLESQLDIVDASLERERFLVKSTGALGGLALLFAALGVYATLAYWVSRRRYELGVRQALGARSSDVLQLVLWRGLLPVAIGIGVGVALALGLARLTSSLWRDLLFEIAPWDVPTLGGVAAVLMSSALLACLVPAIQAARVDPGTTLREE